MLRVLDVLLKLGFSKEFIGTFKHELRLLQVRFYAFLSLRQRLLLRMIKKQKKLKVNLACGLFTKPGWISVDCSRTSKADLYWDLLQRLPFSDNNCAYIFCEHFLEHLSYPIEVHKFLADCYRILEDGGTLRLILPDVERVIKAYAEGDVEFLKKAAPQSNSLIEELNLIFHGNPLGEHHYAYDFSSISELLKGVGFRQVLKLENGVGSIAAELDRRDEPRMLESLAVEAIK